MTDWNDPEDSPIIRHVLYTNDVKRVLGSFISGLLMVARPERVKLALQQQLDNFDQAVATVRALGEHAAAAQNEPSGWEEPPDPDTN